MHHVAIHDLRLRGQGSADLEAIPLVILVGVTGVGKSTTLAALEALGCPLALLPDRRELTDRFILGGEPVRDREERFRRTAAYREQHPGGMSAVLAGLSLARPPQEQLVFDGLRGLEEVEHAARHLPRARFVVLDAPDVVRIERLVSRADAFDAVSVQVSGSRLEALENLEGVREVLSEAELRELARLPVEPAELAAGARIVIAERRNYDPQAAAERLMTLDPLRTLYLDTATQGPELVASRIAQWL
ncbi:energy-coupling factor transporter ATP-binding protein EcfA2 [Deinobacterium chartae]|uniref:Energy-coupling factor transporter ATP-binding protein EcfA2 n=1 Tax=Deinobacterium chartae TaxID=521158 RepID=A0A841HX63_9DEIO|nr:AAA family ATPase [Deinobacterium chartae]MBB6097443.1 energy-coupling factor transporter ATP-binding protein EcfA2 [Deinobacterium chartae]